MAGEPYQTGRVPRIVGVIHLPPLPGSARFDGDAASCARRAARDAEVLSAAGFDGIVVENFGDAPFSPRSVEPVTVAAMTACVLAARAAAPDVALGVNVLRNDAVAAVSIAAATGADFVRVNVHSGARVTDQGVIEGRADETLRVRRLLGAERVLLLCDVDVKHSAPLGAPRPLGEQAQELVERALADAVLVTGTGTGAATRASDVDEALAATSAPVLVASGTTPETLASFARAHGVVVGSWLRADGRAGGPIDPARARTFAEAARRVWPA